LFRLSLRLDWQVPLNNRPVREFARCPVFRRRGGKSLSRRFVWIDCRTPTFGQSRTLHSFCRCKGTEVWSSVSS